MRQHHFVAVSGPKNCGKSRILKELKQSLEAEVRNMKEIERRFKAKAGMKWKVAYISLNRDENPFDLLTRAIAGPASNILVSSNEKVDPLFESSIRAALTKSDGDGLLRIYRQFLEGRQYNFLVIVDQFENLFFSTMISHEEKAKFIKLLLNASFLQRQLYVTLAIRPPKADLWKQNFKDLSDAVESCRYRLYNPNQIELEEAIGATFISERERNNPALGQEDMFSMEWLQKQDVYQEIAVKRIRQIAEDLHDILKSKWKKAFKESNGVECSPLVPASNVKVITKQLRGVVDLIWPQLALQSNLGQLGKEERDDLVDDLKNQMTDLLTSELLVRLSRLLAEELYFEREPLTQIEKHVRQLTREWNEVLHELRKENRRRSREIITVSLESQRANQVGAASLDYRVDRSGPAEERAEKAYMALRTALDKRIARKALTILVQNSMLGKDASLSVDGLAHAMGRFQTRIIPVLEVFVHAGILEVEPAGGITYNTKLFVGEPALIDTWKRLREWLHGPSETGLASSLNENADGETLLASPNGMEAGITTRFDLIEDFGAHPSDADAHVSRIELLYTNLQPSIRKRAARRLFVEMARKDPENKGYPESMLLENIGRFHDQLREIIEYFIRQGILAPEGGLHFKESLVPKKWERLKEWLKTE